jgi:hypothetical protein
MEKLTYTATVEKPRLVIVHDDIESPRIYQDNLGYFITVGNKYNSPDHKPVLEAIVKQTGEEAQDLDDHIHMIRQRVADEMNEVVTAIYPVYRHEHGNVLYKRGTAQGFDVSNNGFYIVTNKGEEKYGDHAKPIEALIDGELEEYTAWANGEVYSWTLYGEDGEEIDAGGGYFDLDEIKAELPKEWQNENLLNYIEY